MNFHNNMLISTFHPDDSSIQKNSQTVYHASRRIFSLFMFTDMKRAQKLVLRSMRSEIFNEKEEKKSVTATAATCTAD